MESIPEEKGMFIVKDVFYKLLNLTTVEALVSNHLGNSEKWSQLELVAYENGLI